MGQAMHCKLLPSFTSSNMQQRLIPNPVFEFLGKKKKLFSAAQFGFCSNSSCKKLTYFRCLQHLCKFYFAEIMIKDLIKISEWANQWKISFKLELTKQAQEVIFS